MKSESYSRLLENRKRIDEKTLIIGEDICNSFNAIVLMDQKGNVLGEYPKVYNSSRGFEFFQKNIEKVIEKRGLKRVILGLEPTGHYWRKLAYYNMSLGYKVRFVKTTALKHQRELDENSLDKCDIQDDLTLCNLIREGKYLDSRIQEEICRQLRTLGKVKERITRYHTGTKHALKAVLDDYFLELN